MSEDFFALKGKVREEEPIKCFHKQIKELDSAEKRNAVAYIKKDIVKSAKIDVAQILLSPTLYHKIVSYLQQQI